MTKLAPYAKAVTGALVAGLASAQQALLDDGAISSAEGVGIAIATLTALALVWAIPNSETEPEQEPDYEARILGKAFTGGMFSAAEEDARNGDPHRP